MTMINAMALGRVGMLATDSAFYDAQGIVHSFGRKSHVCEKQKAAFAVRGDVSAGATLADEFNRFPTFDEIVVGAASLIEAAFNGDAFLQGDDPRQGHIDVIVLGWSARAHMCRCFALTTAGHPGIEPFRFHRRDSFWAPAPPLADMERIGLVRGGFFNRPKDDPAATFLQMAELQRLQRNELFPGSAVKAHTVGGAVRLTTVTKDEVTEKIVHRWPDVAGESIDPHAPANVVPISAGRAVRQRRTAALRGQGAA